MISFSGLIHPTDTHNQKLGPSMSSVFGERGWHENHIRNLEITSNAPLYSTDSYLIAISGSYEGNEEHLIKEYEKFGENAFHQLDGDFAIAFFDKKKGLLFLIRDPIGRKSLYWATFGGYFLFSTEIKRLLATGIVPQTPSTIGFASYLYFGFIPQDFSAIDGVHKLLPGHFLKIDLAQDMRIIQYWSLSKALLEGKKSDPVKEESIEKLPLPTPESAIKDLVKIVWNLGEPIADVSITTVFEATKLKPKNTPLLIDTRIETIQGKDQDSKPPPSLSYFLARWPKPLQKYLIFPLAKALYPNLLWRILRNIDINSELHAHLPSMELFSPSQRKNVSKLLNSCFDPETFFERFHRLGAFKTKGEQVFYLNAKTKLPDSILFQYEHLLSPSGIKFETPFVTETKSSTPLFTPEWYDHPEWKELFSMLEHGRLVEENLISRKWLRYHLGFPHLIEKTFRRLFALLILEIWFRLYINQPMGKVNLNQSVKELLS